LGFLQEKTLKPQKSKFYFLKVFLKKTLKNHDFSLTVTAGCLLPFNIISCVYTGSLDKKITPDLTPDLIHFIK